MEGGTAPESWMQAPFHTVSLLRPSLNVAGFYDGGRYTGEGTDSDDDNPVVSAHRDHQRWDRDDDVLRAVRLAEMWALFDLANGD